MTTRTASAAAPACDKARVQALLDAHREITSDLLLGPMLERIVTKARELVGAESAGVAVVGPDGSIEDLVAQGVDPATVSALSAGGYPDGIQSLLRVAIPARDVTFGELYVLDSAPGRFGAEDADLLTALAASAGTAIENARLFDQARRSRNWLDAAAEVARALLADADEEALLDVVSQALDVGEADYASLILPVDRDKLKVVVAKGSGAEHFLHHVFTAAESPLGRAIIAGESCQTKDIACWTNPGFVNQHGWGPAMLAPLVDAHGARGAIVLIRNVGRRPFAAEDVRQASTFATQVALALELHDARADAEWLGVVEDRHRIAEDLHDNVMQRLFATGMGLQALAAASGLAGADAERLARCVADLDDTIDQIRVRVFDLRSADPPPLRHQRGRYPHVGSGPSAAKGGASETSTGENPGLMRRLSRPTVPGGDA